MLEKPSGNKAQSGPKSNFFPGQGDCIRQPTQPGPRPASEVGQRGVAMSPGLNWGSEPASMSLLPAEPRSPPL